ncbi:MAG: choice-of-anchor M domain-containing protein [Bifidobacteriaceae bacterium]|nr:choice-of-anchor M domain-containing protein [Bifidobacteriaceae bacterium]
MTLFANSAAAIGQDGDDPNLDQTVAAGQTLVHGETSLDSGHVDMGPKFLDGQWTFLIHDDAAKADAAATSVWRYPAETAIHVLDQATMTVPDDPAYAFVGAAPGETVWVVPQTQNPEVVWLGWNTQDPEVMAAIDRGITLSLSGAQGPGVVTVYLQSGGFGEPQVLFDSRAADPQSVWVDVNTHTHANWVFTAPGVYLLALTAEADLIDGTHATDTQLVRFAIGSDTPPTSALTAVWNGTSDAVGAGGSADNSPVEGGNASSNASDAGAGQEVAASVGGEGSERADAGGGTGRDPGGEVPGTGGLGTPLVPVLTGAIILTAGGLAAGVLAVIVRQNRAKKRALAGRMGRNNDELNAEEPGQ